MSNSFVTPWTVGGSFIHGISQARILEWVTVSLSVDLYIHCETVTSIRLVSTSIAHILTFFVCVVRTFKVYSHSSKYAVQYY